MDCTKTNEKAMSWLKGNLDEERLLHSLGSAQCAAELANRFGLDEKKAYVAGLLHDCAKCLDSDKMQQLAKEIDLDDCERDNFKVVHAPVSAYLAENEFGIKDKEILSAIRLHTVGKLNMTLFEKIIYLADKIEPNTRDLDFRDRILLFFTGDKSKEELEFNLNRALFLCFKETIKSLVTRGLKICQTTIDVYNDMLQ